MVLRDSLPVVDELDFEDIRDGNLNFWTPQVVSLLSSMKKRESKLASTSRVSSLPAGRDELTDSPSLALFLGRYEDPDIVSSLGLFLAGAGAAAWS
jgi:hypothetical protein